MAGKTLTASYILDAGGISTGVDKADTEMGRLNTNAGKLSDDFDKNTSRMGSSLEKVGNTLGNFGIPFSNSISTMGQHLDEAKSKGSGLKQVMSDIGGVTLGVVGVGLAAVGAESVKMADAFDVAQAQVQVAVKNSGQNFQAVKPSIDAAETSLANFGFNSTEAATSLSLLETSTGNTKKAEADLSIAADLARAKHISLSEATSILTKTLAGSTRGLTTLGLNLDIGSGKLKTIASDTTAYQKTQDALHGVEQRVADGTLKGAAAYSALLTAHAAVSTSSQKLQLDQGTIAKILDTVKEKTAGAAAAFGDTLAGKEAIAGAKAHDLGTSFGEFLIPKLIGVENAVMDVVGWFEKHKAASEALAITIGTVLVGAIGVFTVNMVSGMIGSVQRALGSLGLMSGSEDATAASTDRLSEALTALEAQLASSSTAEDSVTTADAALNVAWTETAALADELDSGLATLAAAYEAAGGAAAAAAPEIEAAGAAAATSGPEIESAGAAASTAAPQLEAAGAAAATAAPEIEAAGAAAATAAPEIEAAGAAAATTSTEMAGAGTAAGASGAAGGMGAAAEASGGLAASLGTVALAAGAATVAGIFLGKAIGATSSVTQTGIGQTNASANVLAAWKAAAEESGGSSAQLTLKLGDLQHAQALAAAGTDMNKNAILNVNSAAANYVAYQTLGNQIDIVRGQQLQLSNNLNILSAGMGINKSQAQALAASLGINLSQALTRPEVDALKQQLDQTGLSMDTTGSKAQTMSSNTVAALSNVAATMKTTLSSADWEGAGEAVMSGLAQGIVANMGAPIGAASNAAAAVLTAANHALGSHSPSREFMKVGANAMAGAAIGVDQNAHLFSAAVTSAMSGAIPTTADARGLGLAAPVAAGAAAGGAAGGLTVQVIVQGHVLTDRQLVDTVYEGLLQKGIVNGSNGQLTAAG